MGLRAGKLLSHRSKASHSSSWPTGALGNVTISSNVQIVPGTVLDYNNLTITSTGWLEVFDNYANGIYDGTFDSSWVIIGVKGTLTIASGGKITYNENSLGPTNTGEGPGTFTTVATPPTGAIVSSLSYSLTCHKGGNGGQNGDLSQGGGTDGSIWGHGAGGGGANFGNDTGDDIGYGVSGAGSDNTEGTGGFGGQQEPPPFGVAGLSGDGSSADIPLSTYYGAGGGGAVRGLTGGGIYIQCNAISVSGLVIDISGSNGFQGGYGGDTDGNPSPLTPTVVGGGGGGGSAGCDGGKLVLRYHSGTFTSANVKYSGGMGGAGGLGGTAYNGQMANINGQAGLSGQSGNIGILDIATF